jgi:hypothetical protein
MQMALWSHGMLFMQASQLLLSVVLATPPLVDKYSALVTGRRNYVPLET